MPDIVHMPSGKHLRLHHRGRFAAERLHTIVNAQSSLTVSSLTPNSDHVSLVSDGWPMCTNLVGVDPDERLVTQGS